MGTVYTGNDRYSGDRYSGIDRFSGTKTSDDNAILFTANDYFSGNDRYSGTKNPDRFFHYNGRCLYFFSPQIYLPKFFDHF